MVRVFGRLAFTLAFAWLILSLQTKLTAAQTAEAKIPETVVAGLPRSFYGLFIWREPDTVGQAVEVKIVRVEANEAGFFTAHGAAIYTDIDGPSKVRMAITVDAQTLSISIREFQPEQVSTMMTNGRHVGRISRGLRRIDAQWTAKYD